ncbi:macrolide ABC transporter permease/ATP-binding protein MacB [Methylomonas sp. LWB]|uniref:MacB family efflux pump subunit n=1 Tax=Methylomonas sp. LWB TaxID=1905845 RepID=UPI0008D99E82|nr:MacB family efflux pump subunit [Methylomonas sp. LWB]OHX34642.1 macrolide ABC transporter permease/ATP-binding protein MacB [Methylomonas sp. LWB]
MNQTPLLQLTDIQRVYPNGDATVRALDGVSLTIWPGEFVAIVGQSGSGKSTLMNLIGCLDRADAGAYRVLGRDVADLDPDQLAALRRDSFGFVFQRYNLLNTATATENVEIPALYAGLPKLERRRRALQLLSKLGLAERGEHRPMQLSGGQQQRVAIARALINDPPVILADEPTGALDSHSGMEVMSLLGNLHAEGRTVLLITHDEKIAAHAQRVIHIADGKIVGDGEAHIGGSAVPPPAHPGIGGAGLAAELGEAAKTALRSLRVNLFRTALTLLGIVIGVAAVVTMLAVGQGSQEKVLEQMRAMGTDILSIRPGLPGFRGGGDVATLTLADTDAIAELANVASAAPERNGRMTVRYASVDYATSVQGVASSMPWVRDWPIALGDFFDERDQRRYAPVVVLGETVRKLLFAEGEDPLGRFVMIGNIPFEVIGVMATKGADAQGSDRDDAVFVPITTGLTRLFGQKYLGGVTVRVEDVVKIDATQQAITDLLIARHQTEDFRIRNMASIIESATETQNTFTLMLGIVAAISLLVGGIGVMNIMLVSVTERTREIGIRIATGARRRDILLQFNTEAAVVCTLGGFMGVLLGFAAGYVLKYFEMAVLFSPLPAILAFSCAFGTGVLFGYLPARKAAFLDPVVALAAE